jgi:hypothetical protein
MVAGLVKDGTIYQPGQGNEGLPDGARGQETLLSLAANSPDGIRSGTGYHPTIFAKRAWSNVHP